MNRYVLATTSGREAICINCLAAFSHLQLLSIYIAMASHRGKPPAACQEELLGGAQLEPAYGIISYQLQVFTSVLLAPDTCVV